MNFAWLVDRFRKKPEAVPCAAERCCVSDDTAVFYDMARVVNLVGDPRNIRIGAHSHIRGELLTFGHGGRIEIGDYCYLGHNSYVWSGKSIRIGNRVLISHNCNIFDNNTHPLDPVERHKQFKEVVTVGHPKEIDLHDKEIVIGDDVLIAANAIILKGVTIGEGAVIGAGSVVVKDVSAYTVVAGNPARFIKKIEVKRPSR